MRTASIARLTASIVLIPLVACTTDSGQRMLGIEANRFAGSEWSEPVNLGPVVNSSAVDANAALSPDEHALYFVSNRLGGVGGNDIWVSRRRCLECPWETPVNLGAPINSGAVEGAPTLSDDGRLLFFFSIRPDGLGSADIYVSHRTGTNDEGDVWGPPVNLGPDVNTAGAENGVYYVREGGEPTAVLYFNRTPAGGSLDIYKVSVTNDGVPIGPAVAVPELNDPTGADQKVAVRTDGLELLLSSIRTGGFGNFDLWAFTRQTVHDAWSTPVHLDAPLNTPDVESQPSLSRDGRALIFTSTRPEGQGLQDLWMSTRAPSGQ